MWNFSCCLVFSCVLNSWEENNDNHVSYSGRKPILGIKPCSLRGQLNNQPVLFRKCRCLAWMRKSSLPFLGGWWLLHVHLSVPVFSVRALGLFWIYFNNYATPSKDHLDYGCTFSHPSPFRSYSAAQVESWRVNGSSDTKPEVIWEPQKMTEWGRELNSKCIVLQRRITQNLNSDKYLLMHLKNEDKYFWLPE